VRVAHSAEKRSGNIQVSSPASFRYLFGVMACGLLFGIALGLALNPGVSHARPLARLRNGEVVKLLELQSARSRSGGKAEPRSLEIKPPRALGFVDSAGGKRFKSSVPSRGVTVLNGELLERFGSVLKEFSEVLEPVRNWNDLLTWYKAYRSLPATDTQPELRAENINFGLFLMEPVTGAMVPPNGLMTRIRNQAGSILSTWADKTQQGHLRVSWSNSELDQWIDWTQERDRALVACSERLREIVLRDGPELFGELSDSERLKSLLGWASVVAMFPGSSEGAGLDSARIEARDRVSAWTIKRLGLEGHPKFQSLDSRESQVLFRALALALVPTQETGEALPNWRTPAEPPFGLVARLDAEGSGRSREFRTDWLENYRNYRDLDQPELPVHPAPHPEAVHVAFIDTGVDWREHPELGEYLGLGREGELSQYDFADGDENPWAPAVGDLGHGSGVMATLLTLIAHQEPRLLEERRLDMALWKTASIRSLLAVGADPDLRRFDLRQELSYMQAFVEAGALSEERSRVTPDIVSISSSFPLRRVTSLHGLQPSFKSNPWVWVMAAGNGGRELNPEAGDPSCMGDLPGELKPASRLICVGALKRGILRDSISKYSNYGPLVDLYTFESFSGLCPSGTSCSTPAISAALAMLKARYRTLSPEQLKQVVLEASAEKAVEQEVNGQKRSVRVRVFDPTSMMSKAYIIASRVVRSPSR
jgi:hypothetical protein